MNAVSPAPPTPTLERLAAEEAGLLALPQLELPVKHLFAPGCYARELLMPAGSLVMGHEHKTEHFNVMLSGRMRVFMDGEVRDMVAPCICVSKAGTRKVALILVDVIWVTFHPTDETNVEKLESDLIVKSAAYLSHEQRLDAAEALRALAESTKESA